MSKVIGNWLLVIGELSQILKRYVIDACRKYLPFLRQSFVTKIYFFVTGRKQIMSQIFTKFATLNKIQKDAKR